MTKHKVATITVQELHERQKQDHKLCLIDVRENHEWETGHIPGAIHLPKNLIGTEIENKIPKKNQPIYLHCLGGVRSLQAAHFLHDMGYEEVYSINGGIAEWEKNGYPIEK